MITKDDIFALTNNDKRKAFIKDWEQWPVLVEVPQLNLVVRKVDLPDGSAFCASYYEGTAYRINYGEDAGKTLNSPRYCLLKTGEKYRPDNASEYQLLEHLMGLRRKLKEEENQGKA